MLSVAFWVSNGASIYMAIMAFWEFVDFMIREFCVYYFYYLFGIDR